MVRGKDLEEGVKANIVSMRQKGNSLGKIATLLDLPKSTVQSVMDNYVKYGTLESQKPGNVGRKRATTIRLDNQLVIEVKRNPRITRQQLRRTAARLGANISLKTITNRLKEAKLPARRPVRAPLLKLVHRQNRKKFAKEHKGS